MYPSLFFTTFTALAAVTSALPSSLQRRDIPPRPEGIGHADIHGSLFEEQVANKNFEAAVVAAPVWFFGSYDGTVSPCMPETAVIVDKDGNPTNNPGTSGNGKFWDIGANCNDPAVEKGPRTKTHAFPNYITTSYCGPAGHPDERWLVTYSIYYVRDSGHRHDWESATVVWKRVRADQDWWYRYELIISNHGTRHKRLWTQIESSETTEDIINGGSTHSSLHPHVYSGMYTHANFFTADTSLKAFAVHSAEYRSDNWYFMPEYADMKHHSEVNKNWDYGDTSNPSKIDTCSW